MQLKWQCAWTCLAGRCLVIHLIARTSRSVISTFSYTSRNFKIKQNSVLVYLTAVVFKLWYAESCQVVRHKVYKNIKLKNQTIQPFLLKMRCKEQRSEYTTPFTSHSSLRTLEINRTLYHSVLLCYETLSERSMKPPLQIVCNKITWAARQVTQVKCMWLEATERLQNEL